MNGDIIEVALPSGPLAVVINAIEYEEKGT